MVREAVQDYAATAAGAVHERVDDVVSPPVLPVIKDPRIVGEDDYQLNYDGVSGSGELDWPGDPAESTTSDPKRATEEISEDVDQELAGQPTESKWALGKIAVAKWLLGKSDKSSGVLGIRQEVATQRGSSASFTGESTRGAHNKREGARQRVSKLVRKRETVERKKWAVENSSLAYGDKTTNHRKAMRHRIDAAQASAASDRLARGVQLTPSKPNKTSEISVETPIVINRERLDPETGKIYWTSESPLPNNPNTLRQGLAEDVKSIVSGRKGRSVFDSPADAIDAINTGGLSPFVRANEARQLNKWLRLHKEDSALRGELQDMAEGRDFAGRRIRRGIARRRDFAHRLLTSAGAEDAASLIPTSDGYQARSRGRARRKDWRQKKATDFKEGNLDTPTIDNLDLTDIAQRKATRPRANDPNVLPRTSPTEEAVKSAARSARSFQKRSTYPITTDARIRRRSRGLADRASRDYSETRVGKLAQKYPKLRKMASAQERVGRARTMRKARKIQKLSHRAVRVKNFKEGKLDTPGIDNLDLR